MPPPLPPEPASPSDVLDVLRTVAPGAAPPTAASALLAHVHMHTHVRRHVLAVFEFIASQAPIDWIARHAPNFSISPSQTSQASARAAQRAAKVSFEILVARSIYCTDVKPCFVALVADAVRTQSSVVTAVLETFSLLPLSCIPPTTLIEFLQLPKDDIESGKALYTSKVAEAWVMLFRYVLVPSHTNDTNVLDIQKRLGNLMADKQHCRPALEAVLHSCGGLSLPALDFALKAAGVDKVGAALADMQLGSKVSQVWLTKAIQKLPTLKKLIGSSRPLLISRTNPDVSNENKRRNPFSSTGHEPKRQHLDPLAKLLEDYPLLNYAPLRAAPLESAPFQALCEIAACWTPRDVWELIEQYPILAHRFWTLVLHVVAKSAPVNGTPLAAIHELARLCSKERRFIALVADLPLPNSDHSRPQQTQERVVEPYLQQCTWDLLCYGYTHGLSEFGHIARRLIGGPESELDSETCSALLVILTQATQANPLPVAVINATIDALVASIAAPDLDTDTRQANLLRMAKACPAGHDFTKTIMTLGQAPSVCSVYYTQVQRPEPCFRNISPILSLLNYLMDAAVAVDDRNLILQLGEALVNIAVEAFYSTLNKTDVERRAPPEEQRLPVPFAHTFDRLITSFSTKADDAWAHIVSHVGHQRIYSSMCKLLLLICAVNPQSDETIRAFHTFATALEECEEMKRAVTNMTDFTDGERCTSLLSTYLTRVDSGSALHNAIMHLVGAMCGHESLLLFVLRQDPLAHVLSVLQTQVPADGAGRDDMRLAIMKAQRNATLLFHLILQGAKGSACKDTRLLLIKSFRKLPLISAVIGCLYMPHPPARPESAAATSATTYVSIPHESEHVARIENALGIVDELCAFKEAVTVDLPGNSHVAVAKELIIKVVKCEEQGGIIGRLTALLTSASFRRMLVRDPTLLRMLVNIMLSCLSTPVFARKLESQHLLVYVVKAVCAFDARLLARFDFFLQPLCQIIMGCMKHYPTLALMLRRARVPSSLSRFLAEKAQRNDATVKLHALLASHVQALENFSL